MFVCMCFGISDKRLKSEINSGARSLPEVQKRCQAGLDCGTCVNQIEKIINQEVADSGGSKERP